MYRFKSAMRLFTPTAATSIFGSRRRYGRKILPPEFSTNVVRLKCESTAEGGECEVYVVGTIHDYQKSVEDVKNVVNFVKPQVVFLELCSSRTDGILYPPKVRTWRLGPLSFEYTRHKDQVDSEFRIAFKEANKCGAKVILGDRPTEITRMRYHDKLCRMPWHAIKMANMVLLTPRDFEKAMNSDNMYKRTYTPDDVTYQINPFRDVFVVDERDQLIFLHFDLLKKHCYICYFWTCYPPDIALWHYVHVSFRYMSARLLEVAREHSSIVAVVGKAHLLGIQKYWKQPVEMKQLLSVPPPVCRNRMIVGALAIFLTTLLYFL